MNLENQIKPVEEAFSLLSRSKQLEVTYNSTFKAPDLISTFETNLESFNVLFERVSSKRNYTGYKISIRDQDKKELFKVNLVYSQPLFELPSHSIYLQVHGKTIQDPEQISDLLKSSSFEKILDTINLQTKDIIKKQEEVADLSLKSNHELVNHVLERINKIRPDLKSTTPYYGFKD